MTQLWHIVTYCAIWHNCGTLWGTVPYDTAVAHCEVPYHMTQLWHIVRYCAIWHNCGTLWGTVPYDTAVAHCEVLCHMTQPWHIVRYCTTWHNCGTLWGTVPHDTTVAHCEVLYHMTQLWHIVRYHTTWHSCGTLWGTVPWHNCGTLWGTVPYDTAVLVWLTVYRQMVFITQQQLLQTEWWKQYHAFGTGDLQSNVSSEFMFCLYQSSIATGHVELNKLYQFSQQEPVCSTKDLTYNQHPTNIHTSSVKHFLMMNIKGNTTKIISPSMQ